MHVDHFETGAVRLNGPEAEGVELKIAIEFTDLGQAHLLELSNAVLYHRPLEAGAAVDARLKLTHGMFIRVLTGQAGLRDALFGDELETEGNPLDLVKFFGLLEKPEGRFNIVTP